MRQRIRLDLELLERRLNKNKNILLNCVVCVDNFINHQIHQHPPNLNRLIIQCAILPINWVCSLYSFPLSSHTHSRSVFWRHRLLSLHKNEKHKPKLLPDNNHSYEQNNRSYRNSQHHHDDYRSCCQPCRSIANCRRHRKQR